MFIGMPFIFLGGGVVLFMSSWLVFGFGQLVDDVHSFRFGNKTENDKERIGFENSSNMEESKIEELEYYKKLLDSGKITKLEYYKKLLDSGKITEEEFVNIEKMIIGQ